MRIISEKKVPIEEVRKILTEKEKREGLTEIERQTLESVCRVLNEKGVKDDVEALKVVEELANVISLFSLPTGPRRPLNRTARPSRWALWGTIHLAIFLIAGITSLSIALLYFFIFCKQK